ncbi:hypothetical protein ACQP0C_02185 [Nocardia sp. CA-129566]|uniref:hypothetical protein n=1 Tax=Nocardia sp. CA-129566 TaxID=3239976 RepID=UPI003D981477
MRDGNGFGADDRRALRERLIALGLTDKQLLEPMAIELRQRGCRPRTAWRHANDFTQAAVADRYNEIVGDQAAMRSSRISERGMAQRQNEAEHRQARRDASDHGGAETPSDPDIPKSELHERVVGHVQGRVSSVHVIDGPPGVGKTVLARYAVAAFARHYPDGTIWIDMHGHTVDREPREPADVLERLLLEIGVPPESIEADPALRADQWRTTFSANRLPRAFSIGSPPRGNRCWPPMRVPISACVIRCNAGPCACSAGIRVPRSPPTP